MYDLPNDEFCNIFLIQFYCITTGPAIFDYYFITQNYQGKYNLNT